MGDLCVSLLEVCRLAEDGVEIEEMLEGEPQSLARLIRDWNQYTLHGIQGGITRCVR